MLKLAVFLTAEKGCALRGNGSKLSPVSVIFMYFNTSSINQGYHCRQIPVAEMHGGGGKCQAGVAFQRSSQLSSTRWRLKGESTKQPTHALKRFEDCLLRKGLVLTLQKTAKWSCHFTFSLYKGPTRFRSVMIGFNHPRSSRCLTSPFPQECKFD
jgi:hypothetical protein